MADLLSADAFHRGQVPYCTVLYYVYMLYAVVPNWCNVAMLKVTLTTVAELYNDDGNTINHHGFKRKIMKEEVKVKIYHAACEFSH